MHYRLKQDLVGVILNYLKQEGLLTSSATHRNDIDQRLIDLIQDSSPKQSQYDSREVTILLSDLRGFTSLSERFTPAQMIELLNRYFHEMNQIIFRYGGTIDKIMGDAIMVLFGAPESNNSDLSRALACAIEMQTAMGAFNRQNEALAMPPIYMGIGINSGQVVAGNVGSSLHSEYTVIGDQVNLASRVEAHCLRGQRRLSENSYQRAKHYIEVGTSNEYWVKGQQLPVKMYELLGIEQPVKLRAPKRDIRKSVRVPVNMPLAFRALKGKHVSNFEQYGTIVDISYGGLSTHTHSELMPQSEIKTSLSLSLMGHENRDVYARVLRSEQKHHSFESHMEITHIDPQAEFVLKQFVDDRVTLNSSPGFG